MDARTAALNILRRTEEDGAYANLELDRLLSSGELPKKDKNLCTKLVYGTLQNRELLDSVLRGFITRGFNKLRPAVKNALRLGAYQILMLDAIPDYAAIDAAVSQVRKTDRRQAGMANGVLRNIARNHDRILGDIKTAPARIRASVPEWIADLYTQSYGEQAEEILGMMNSRPPLTVRVNTLKTERHSLMKELADAGIGSVPASIGENSLILDEGSLPDGGIEALPAFKEGRMIVQDAGAALIGEMLSPEQDTEVFDLCAAPGGKTTHLAAIMKNTGTIHAGDIHANRLALIRENAERLGCTDIDPVQMDASLKPDESETGACDSILLDAPCSGLGIIRRKPDIRYRVSPADLPGLEKLQAGMLDAADDRLKSGGRLVYSTCTVNPEENEKQIRRFLEKHDDYRLVRERRTSPLEDADCFYMCELKKA